MASDRPGPERGRGPLVRIAVVYAILLFTAVAAWTQAQPSRAETSVRYVGPGRLDSTRFLPPPPASGSRRQAADEAEVAELQATKGDARWALAQADDDISPFAAFASVLGPGFTAEQAPKTAKLFEVLFSDVKDQTAPAKVAFARPRPPIVSPGLETCRPLEQTYAYPSGHAARGWMMALLLTEMLPDRADQLLSRGYQYGQSRVVCAEHFPSDVEAGRQVGAAVLAVAWRNPQFRRDVAEAQVELLAVLRSEPARPSMPADKSVPIPPERSAMWSPW